MSASFTQDSDVFSHTEPGILFDAVNESWTISGQVLVASGTSDGVQSSFDGSTLSNAGVILSTAQFGAGRRAWRSGSRRPSPCRQGRSAAVAADNCAVIVQRHHTDFHVIPDFGI